MASIRENRKNGKVISYRFTAFCAVRVVKLCADTLAVCVIDVSCGIAPVLGYEDITVGYGEIVNNVVPCYRFLVVLHRRADLGLPRSLPVRSSVRQEAEIIRSVAAVLKVGVLISSIFVLADLYVFDPYSERVVDVGRAFAVRLLTLDELVLRAVGVIRYPVRRCLLRSEQHREPSPVFQMEGTPVEGYGHFFVARNIFD